MYPKRFSMIEIFREESEGEVAIRGLRWMHSKRMTYLRI